MKRKRCHIIKVWLKGGKGGEGVYGCVLFGACMIGEMFFVICDALLYPLCHISSSPKIGVYQIKLLSTATSKDISLTLIEMSDVKREADGRDMVGQGAFAAVFKVRGGVAWGWACDVCCC